MIFTEFILHFMDRTFVDRIALDAERQRARDVAQALLDGQTTVLEAVRALSFTSVVTLKPANGGQGKTGQRR